MTDFNSLSAASQVFLPVSSCRDFQITANRVFRDDVGRVRWIIADSGQWFGVTYRSLDKNWQIESLTESWRVWRTNDCHHFRAYEVSGKSVLDSQTYHLYFKGRISIDQHSGKISIEVDSSGYELAS